MFSDKIEERLELYRGNYYSDIHSELCNAIGVPINSFIKHPDPTTMDIKFIDETKLFDIFMEIVKLNRLLEIYPKTLFDFSFYPKGFADSIDNISETIDALIESVTKYKGTLSYIFLWDILVLNACNCDLLVEAFLECLRLQIGEDYENI